MDQDEILEKILKKLCFITNDIKDFTINLSKNISEYGLYIGEYKNADKFSWDVAKSLLSKHKLCIEYENDIKNEIKSKIIAENIDDFIIKSIIDDEFLSKSEKIKRLLDSGMSISSISKSLGVGYQRTKNVFKKYIKNGQ
jgi:hypothetical protein